MPFPPPHAGSGRLIFWIVVTLFLIAAVWYLFLGPGAHGPLLPLIPR